MQGTLIIFGTLKLWNIDPKYYSP